MRYIEPHGHMVSRTTDDYQDMVTAGCAAVCEPAFWAGFDRSSVDGFHDYFCQLTDYEPKRAAKFGLPHFSWLCINPKESEDVALATDVIGIIRPQLLPRADLALQTFLRREGLERRKFGNQRVELGACFFEVTEIFLIFQSD